MRSRPRLLLSLALQITLACAEPLDEFGVDVHAVDADEQTHPSDTMRDLPSQDEANPADLRAVPDACVLLVDCPCQCPDNSFNEWGVSGPCGTELATEAHCVKQCLEHCPPIELPDCREFLFGGVAACLDGDPNALDKDLSKSVVGEVIASGRGSAESGCSRNDRGIRIGADFSEPDTVWFRVLDASTTTWLFEMSAPGIEAPETGLTVSIVASPSLFEMRGTDDTPRASIVRGSRPWDLSLPPFVASVMPADRACVTFGSCLNWAGHDLLLFSNDNGSLRVPLGSSGRLDSITITNAILIVDVATTQEPCEEPSAADVLLAFVWKQTPED